MLCNRPRHDSSRMDNTTLRQIRLRIMRTRLAVTVVNSVLALLVPVAMVSSLATTLLLAWNVLLWYGTGWALISLVVGGPVIACVARLAALVISLPFALLSEGIGRVVEPPPPAAPAYEAL